MSNASSGQPIFESGANQTEIRFHATVDSGAPIYKGTLISQLTSGGLLVPFSTASAGHCVGMATADAALSARAEIATRCMRAMVNGTSSDAFADTDSIGAPVYATDDHTVAKTSGTNGRKCVGFFFGLESDGKVRVFLDPIMARLYGALQGLTDSPASADALRDDIITKVAV